MWGHWTVDECSTCDRKILQMAPLPRMTVRLQGQFRAERKAFINTRRFHPGGMERGRCPTAVSRAVLLLVRINVTTSNRSTHFCKFILDPYFDSSLLLCLIDTLLHLSSIPITLSELVFILIEMYVRSYSDVTYPSGFISSYHRWHRMLEEILRTAARTQSDRLVRDTRRSVGEEADGIGAGGPVHDDQRMSGRREEKRVGRGKILHWFFYIYTS